MSFDPRLMVALDEPTLNEAEALFLKLTPVIGVYKIGLTLLGQGGLSLCDKIKAQGFSVFQDWKLHDIGAQVEGAARAICADSCDYLTVHATPQVMKAAVKGRGDSLGDQKTKILGVTVLTSLSDDDLLAMGYGYKAKDLVVRRVDQALEAGIDGVVASPLEAALIAPLVPKDFLIVTPGVRPKGSDINDQNRVATPAEALKDGATHLVIGRPITKAVDPIAAAKAILAEMSKEGSSPQN